MCKCRKWGISYTFCPKIGRVGVLVGAGRVQTKAKGGGVVAGCGSAGVCIVPAKKGFWGCIIGHAPSRGFRNFRPLWTLESQHFNCIK
jgi:hypothetical protein